MQARTTSRALGGDAWAPGRPRSGSRWRLTLPLGLCALTMQACIVRVDFDPVGPDATMQGSWTVAGATPTAELCREIRFVRVRFFVGEGDHRDHPDLVFSCDAGAFDTRPSRIVSAGVWTVGLVAVRADGSVVQEGPTVVLDTAEEDDAHLVVPRFDFSSPG